MTEPIRKYDVIRKRRNASAGPTRRRVEGSPGSAESEGVLAVFDLDGTLMSSNIIETYLWMRLPELGPAERGREIAKLLRRMPSYIQAERRDRGGLLRAVYRRYAGAEVEELNRLADEVLTPHVLERVSAAALRRVREHREAGHRTLLLTGAIRPITRPLAPLFDEIVAADLAVDDRGLATGFLAAPPLVGESRAAWLRRHAAARGLRPDPVVRLRRQLLRPADAAGGRACPPRSRPTCRCGGRPARCGGRSSCGGRRSRRRGATCRSAAGPG